MSSDRDRINSPFRRDSLMPWEALEDRGIPEPSLPSRDEQTYALLVDARGAPLLVVTPRPFGFDPRRIVK